MIIDNFLLFSGTSNGTAGGITSGAYTDAPTTGTQTSTNVIDLGVNGIPSLVNGGGARDIGIGDTPALELLVVVTTAMVGGTSLQVVLQGAPESGTTVPTPGSWSTLWTGPAVALANLTQGAYLANIDVPRVIAPIPMPRYLRLQYVNAGTFTGGSIEAAIVLDRFDPVIGPTGLNSGYPPGIVVAN